MHIIDIVYDQKCNFWKYIKKIVKKYKKKKKPNISNIKILKIYFFIKNHKIERVLKWLWEKRKRLS